MRLKHFKYIFFSLSIFLVGCSRTFIVVPSGGVEGLLFSFYKNQAEDQTAKFNIVEIYVQRLDDQNGWSTIWELKGKEKLSAVKYGSTYEGLSLIVSPAELLTNRKYRVMVSEVSATNPKGFAGSEFLLNKDGLVEVIR